MDLKIKAHDRTVFSVVDNVGNDHSVFDLNQNRKSCKK